MSFSAAAKNLLKTKIPNERTDRDILQDLESAGFSRSDLLSEYRSLYDTTSEDSIKKQILSDMAKIHQLTTPSNDKADAPPIVINVFGDNTRIAAMLNPALLSQ